VFDVAVARGPAEEDIAVLIDRLGGIRLLDPTGWSLPGLAAEFGAAAVYRVGRRAGQVILEGWNGRRRCLLQENTENVRFDLHTHATIPQPRALAQPIVKERSPQVRNSYSRT
jgi:hypothetical protein